MTIPFSPRPGVAGRRRSLKCSSLLPDGCADLLPDDCADGSRRALEANKLHEGPHSYSAVVLEGPGLYRLGTIDLLQEWNWKKRLERLAKIIFKARCQEHTRNGMSAVEPMRYAWRFVHHIGVNLLGMDSDEVRRVWTDLER